MSDTNLATSPDLSRQLEEALATPLATEESGQAPGFDELLVQYPELATELVAFHELRSRIVSLAAKLQAGKLAAHSLTAAEPITEALTGSPDRADSISDATGGPDSTIREAAGPATATTDPDATGPVTLEVQYEPDFLAGGTKVRRFGDYELIELLGRGGMGVVYRARQLSLNRLVALKMLQVGMLAGDDDLRRFQNEAEAVALLDHPHIVPIFEVGRYEEQRYFSMKLIDGTSLDHKLVDYCTNPKAAAMLVAKMADAVHHAHQRGLLHRDLKPSNILLDERNEPHVTDFGLAKRIEGDSELTQSGAILGTPAYMAPEQASGNRAAVTTATDIYGLGAILYALLTGRGPFSGGSVAETLEHVRERTPLPPSRHNPHVSRDLEIICLKCLEKEPGQRYNSARDLAEDLRRFSSGEPILARRIGPLARTLMWCRRNPLLTRLAGLMLLLAFVAGLSMLAVFVVDGARRGEENARREAEADFKMAQEAVFNVLTHVNDNPLFKEQDTLDIRNLRQEILESALPYYQRFVKERSQDLQLREQVGNAYFRLGDITRVIGSSQDAINYYRSALELWEPLARNVPDHPEFQRRVADCFFAMGRLRVSDNLPEAMNWQGHALRIYEPLAAQDPSDSRLQATLAECYSKLAICFSDDQQPEKCLQYLDKARDILLRLVEGHPDDIEYKKGLAEILYHKGYSFFARGEYSMALSTYKQLERLALEILREHPSPAPLKLQNNLAISYYNIGMMYLEQDKHQLALGAFREAEDNWTRLMNLHPSVTSYRADLGRVYMRTADAERQLKHATEALARLKKAEEILDQLVKTAPDNLDYRFDQAWATNLEGVIHDDARRNDMARPLFEKTVQQKRENVRRSNGIDLYNVDLCVGLENLGETYVDLGQVTQGLPYYKEAIDLREKLLKAHPEVRDRATALADTLTKVGEIQRQSGDLEDAGHSYDRAIGVLELQVARDHADRQVLDPLADVLERRANLHEELGQPEKSM